MEMTQHRMQTEELGRHRRASDAQTRTRRPEQQTNWLAWISLGLGLSELMAPRQVARWIGADADSDRTRLTILALGVRELTCGLGLLSRSRPAAWAWARVAGDVMDLAVIGGALQTGNADPARAAAAAAGVLGATHLDARTAIELQRRGHRPLAEGIAVEQSVTIRRPVKDVYEFFRDFANLPTFMSHLESVRVQDGRSHWCAKGPLGSRVEWHAEVMEDRPGELIAWRSLAGADVPNQGRVTFRTTPDGEDTEIVVDLRYDPPAGALGKAFAKAFGKEPAQQISADLRRLKQVLETGEVLHSDASIHPGMHPARPASAAEREQLKGLPQS